MFDIEAILGCTRAGVSVYAIGAARNGGRRGSCGESHSSPGACRCWVALQTLPDASLLGNSMLHKV